MYLLFSRQGLYTKNMIKKLEFSYFRSTKWETKTGINTNFENIHEKSMTMVAALASARY